MEAREVDTLLAAVAARANPDEAQTLAGLVAEVRRRVPELTATPAIERLAPDMCRGHSVAIQQLLLHPQPRDEVQLAAITAPFARDCANWDVPVADVLRTYQTGHELLWRWWTARIAEDYDDAATREPVAARCAELLLAYVGVGMERSVEVHTAELERRTRSAALQQRAEVVALLGADARVDLQRSSRRLRYELVRRHVAFVLWRPEGPAEEHELEAVAVAWAERAAGAHPLLVAGDVRSLWGWIGGVTVRVDPAVAPPTGWRLAIGQPGDGVVGFQDSHAEALAAQTLAAHCRDDARQLFHHEELEALTLLDGDPAALRRFVARALGGLAAPDDRTERLRTTLAAYLRAGANVRAAARDLNYHRNTIQQRLDQAGEARGRPLEDDRLALGLALEIVAFRGDDVLSPRA